MAKARGVCGAVWAFVLVRAGSDDSLAPVKRWTCCLASYVRGGRYAYVMSLIPTFFGGR
jgi:hypothetical protein